MQVDVVLIPSLLTDAQLEGRAVVVFDVLRATTTMTAALAAGVREIRIFGDVDAARAAKAVEKGPCLLAGEIHSLPPPGFDLGNSPRAFDDGRHRDAIMLFSTTNGTRAILAAAKASVIFAGALINASAVARLLAHEGRDVTLLCSGTEGAVSLEDLLGCGAVLEALARINPIVELSDSVLVARRLFTACRDDLAAALRSSRGGHNIQRAGLEADIDFAAQLDRLDIVGRVSGKSPPIVRATAAA